MEIGVFSFAETRPGRAGDRLRRLSPIAGEALVPVERRYVRRGRAQPCAPPASSGVAAAGP